MSKKQPNNDNFKVIYEYMDSGDEDERLHALLERLLPISDLIEIIDSTRADSE